MTSKISLGIKKVSTNSVRNFIGSENELSEVIINVIVEYHCLHLRLWDCTQNHLGRKKISWRNEVVTEFDVDQRYNFNLIMDSMSFDWHYACTPILSASGMLHLSIPSLI